LTAKITTNGRLTGTLDGAINLTVRWNVVSFYCKSTLDYNFHDSKLALDNMAKLSFNIPIAKLPFGIPDVADVSFNIAVEITGEAEGWVKMDVSGTLGFEAGGGLTEAPFYNSLSTVPCINSNGAHINGEVFIGAAFGPSIDFLIIFSIGAELYDGALFSGETGSDRYVDGDQKWHACHDFSCFDGDLKYSTGFSFFLSSVFLSKDLPGAWSFTLPDPFATWYYSDTFKDGNISLLPPISCPHYGYRLYVDVVDQNNQPVKDASVYYVPKETEYNEKASGKTGENGIVTLYVPISKSDQTGKYEPSPISIMATAKGSDGNIYNVTTDFTEKGYKSGTSELETPELTIKLTKHIVTFKDSGPGTAANMPDPMPVYGNNAPLTAQQPSKTGYIFKGWSKNETASTVDYKPGSRIAVDKDIDLYAVWQAASYKITYDLAGGTTGTANPGDYTIETDSFKLNNPTRTGYIFEGWTGTGLSSPSADVIIAKGSVGDRKYTANWIANTYTVTYDKNKPGDASHDVAGTMDGQVFYYATAGNLTTNAYTLPGWTFAGWNTKADGSGTAYNDGASVSKLSKTGAVTLYAQWLPKSYSIHFAADGGTGNMTDQTVKYDTPSALAKNLFSKTGYIFTGWSGLTMGSHYADQQSVTDLSGLDSSGIPSDTTLTADWASADNVTIITTNNGAAFDPTGGVTITQGQTSFDLKKGQTGRYTADSIPDGIYTVKIGTLDTGGRTLTVTNGGGAAHFDYCTVDISSEDHGTSWVGKTGTTELEKVLIGSKLSIGTTVDDGYNFESYTAGGTDPTWEDDDATKAEQEVTVNGETSIQAHPAANLYKVKFDPNCNDASGYMKYQDMVYDEPQNLFLNQYTRVGYDFAGWTATSKWISGEDTYSDGQNVKNLTTEKDDTISLYAQWNGVPSYIEYDANGGTGTMDTQKTYYGSWTNLERNEFTRENWHFTKWNTKYDGSGTSYSDESKYENRNSQKDSTVRLYAQWDHDTYAVNFNANGGRGSMDPEAVWTNSGWEIPLCGFSRTGYTCKEWNTAPDGSGTTYEAGSVPEKDLAEAGGTVTLYAKWTPNKYTVAFRANSGKGTMSDQILTYDAAGRLSANKFTKAHSRFTGWNTKANGRGKSFRNGASVKNLAVSGKLTLYAQWKAKAAPAIAARLSASGKTMKLNWTKVRGATKYVIYRSRCNNGNELRTPKKLRTVKASSRSAVMKDCEYWKIYKFKVAAYKGRKQLCISKTVHCFLGVYSNYGKTKSISWSKKALTLKQGKAKKIKVKIMISKGRRFMDDHAARIRYISMNRNIASVSSKGTIKAKLPGTCTVYAFGADGIWAKLRVTVK